MHTGVRKACPSALGSTGLTYVKPVEELCCAAVGAHGGSPRGQETESSLNNAGRFIQQVEGR